jgi:hypothetical protein
MYGTNDCGFTESTVVCGFRVIVFVVVYQWCLLYEFTEIFVVLVSFGAMWATITLQMICWFGGEITMFFAGDYYIHYVADILSFIVCVFVWVG